MFYIAPICVLCFPMLLSYFPVEFPALLSVYVTLGSMYRSEGAGPERDMLSLREGEGPGWNGEFFFRHQRRRHHPFRCILFFGSGVFTIGPQNRSLDPEPRLQ